MHIPTESLQISLLSSLSPASSSRAWLTAPHPSLPLLATCSSDKTVRIYSLTTFTLLSTITGGHKRSIRTCAWKPNLKGESVLATGSFDASVGIWRRFDDEGGGMNPRPEATNEVEISAGEENADEEEEEWRFALVLDGHESEVKSVSWSAGGNLLATCSRDKSVWIWEEVGEDDYETIAVLQEHEGDVKCVAWHPEEEFLASASYDDEVRLWREEVDDWGCCGVIRGHDGTVWGVVWEPIRTRVYGDEGGVGEEVRGKWVKRREASGPRLLSCSDDLTIRVWRRVPKERVQQSRLSIIRSANSEEEWVEEARLPVVHSRPVYSIAWSKSGRVVSTGGDGLIVVYEERWKKATAEATNGEGEATKHGVDGEEAKEETKATDAEHMEGVLGKGEASQKANGQQMERPNDETVPDATQWVVVAKFEGAHGVFEINHVAFAPRRGKYAEEKLDQEGLIVTTGDDGVVNVWTLDV